MPGNLEVKMETKTYKVYKFNELPEESKEKVIQNYSDINVDYEWWDCTYDDAKTVELKITSFDLDRNRHCEGEFFESAEETAHLIIDNHGEHCETYQTAKNYLKERDKLIENAPKDENGEFKDEYKLDNDLDDLDSEFLKSILEDYSIILQREYEYLTSEEAIIETIEANEYNFTLDGKID